MLTHVYNHIYVLQESETSGWELKNTGIQLVASFQERQDWPDTVRVVSAGCAPGQTPTLAHVMKLTVALAQCVSGGGRAAVYWPSPDDDSPLLVVLYYLIKNAGMRFPNAFVWVADRFRLDVFKSPLLPLITQSMGFAYTEQQLADRKFFFDMLSAVSYTPGPVLSDLYVGSLGTLGNQEVVKSLGIEAVLRLDHLEGRDALQWANNFTLLDLPITDGTPIPEETLLRGTGFIHLHRTNGQKVLVHCIGGVSRSVTFVMAYLIEYMGMSLADAYGRVVFQRAIARPHGKLLGSLVQSYHLPYSLEDAYADQFPDRLLEESCVQLKDGR